MQASFDAEIWYWRGPAPFHFVTVPDEHRDDLQDIAREISYGWGMIPATVTIGSTTFTTSLFPRDDGYVVPIKVRVRRAEQVDEGDIVTVRLTVATRGSGA